MTVHRVSSKQPKYFVSVLKKKNHLGVLTSIMFLKKLEATYNLKIASNE